MLQIIHWHPIFVHFTVALVTVSMLFFIFSWLFARFKIAAQFLTVGRWCLWTAAIFGVVTVIFGFIAFNAVTHDEPAHIVMLQHRNWALVTLIGVVIMTVWSLFTLKKTKPSVLFLLGLIVVFVLLTITAWHGGELVYQHGLGVQSLPQPGPHEHGYDRSH